jgi:hypothetical protein
VRFNGGINLFFHRVALLFGCGAPFLAKSTRTCQAIFLNNFLTAPSRRAPTCGAPELTEVNEDNEVLGLICFFIEEHVRFSDVERRFSK